MDTIQVQVVKAPFGRFRMVAQIGTTILGHALLFKAEHRERLVAQATRIEALLRASVNPEAELDTQHWEGPGKSPELQRRIFKPALAAA